MASVCMRADDADVVGDFAVCGSSSLSHAPDWPCCANLKIDGRGREVRLVRRHAGEPLAHADRVGQLRAAHARQVRLVVEQVELRGRAVLEQVDDALGFGRESAAGPAGRLGGLRSPRTSSDASAAMPMPRARPAEEVAARQRPVALGRSVIALVTISSRFRSTLATEA